MAKVMIIEDDMKVAGLYHDRLVQEGHEVKIVSDVEAVNIIGTEKPDIVLLDILMPKVNGLDILREIKSKSDLEDIPFLVLTNVEDASEVQQAIELGATGYLVKADTSMDLLAQKVKDVIAAGGGGIKLSS